MKRMVVTGNEQVSKRKVTLVLSVEFLNLKTEKKHLEKRFFELGRV